MRSKCVSSLRILHDPKSVHSKATVVQRKRVRATVNVKCHSRIEALGTAATRNRCCDPSVASQAVWAAVSAPDRHQGASLLLPWVCVYVFVCVIVFDV